jgi:hypothetical protein
MHTVYSGLSDWIKGLLGSLVFIFILIVIGFSFIFCAPLFSNLMICASYLRTIIILARKSLILLRETRKTLANKRRENKIIKATNRVPNEEIPLNNYTVEENASAPQHENETLTFNTGENKIYLDSEETKKLYPDINDTAHTKIHVKGVIPLYTGK